MKTLAIAVFFLMLGAAAGIGVVRLMATPKSQEVPILMTSSFAAPEREAQTRQAALMRATQVVDLMIANRRITSEGLDDARTLLRESGQAERDHELQARIAAAVNRGELTLEEAGFFPPG